MRKIVSLFTVVLMLTLCVLPVSVQADSVSFGIRFDKQTYGLGDTAVATVYVTGLTSSVELGGLGTNLSFSADKMEYESGTFAAGITAETTEAELGCVTQNGKEIIYLFFVDADGVSAGSIYNSQTETYDVATITFTVKTPSDRSVSLAFEEVSIVDSLPYKTDIFDTSFNKFNYTFSNPAVAQIEDFVFSGGSAVQIGNVITASPVVCTAVR